MRFGILFAVLISCLALNPVNMLAAKKTNVPVAPLPSAVSKAQSIFVTNGGGVP